jgi:hypothetical protein
MVITRYAADVLGLDAVPKSLAPVRRAGGRVRSVTGTLALVIADIDTDLDTIIVARLPSHATLLHCYSKNDDMGGTVIGTIGLFDSKTGANIDPDCIGTFTWSTTSTSFALDGLIDPTKQGLRLWELAGLAADPGGTMDIGYLVTPVAVTPAAGDVAWEVQYTID